MSSDESDDEESPHKSARGEGEEHPLDYIKLQLEAEIVPKFFTFEEASNCLHMLGKDESGMRYAYLMITATEKKLTDISVVLKFTHVLFLDLTGNKLAMDALRCLADMPYLLYLKVANNIIEGSDLDEIRLLQVLDFSKNKITDTRGIRQPMLECLDLNYNYIEEVLFEDAVPRLKMLELRGNLLDSIRGIYPYTIENLYLAENRIRNFDPEVMAQFVNLKILHLRDNMIRKLNGFSGKMVKLKYLNLRKNRLRKLRQFSKLSALDALEVLVVSQNPICGDEKPLAGEGAEEEEDEEEDAEEEEPLDKFRVSVLVFLPNLKRINKKIVRVEERMAANDQRDERKNEVMEEQSSDDSMSQRFMGEETEDMSVYPEGP